MSTKELSRRYLSAYSNCFTKQEKIDALTDLKILSQSFIDNERYWKLLNSPNVSHEEKKKLILEFPFLKVRPFLKNFLLFINLKSRFFILKHFLEIADQFILDENNSINVNLYSPVKLDNNQLDSVRLFVQTKTNKNPLIEFNIDDSILGGIKIVAGNTTFDSTIINALNKLKLSFN
tara:strand:- start:9 stop:539 length:531 start_codon:yes stop_codon:yes gene_type:complete